LPKPDGNKQFPHGQGIPYQAKTSNHERRYLPKCLITYLDALHPNHHCATLLQYVVVPLWQFLAIFIPSSNGIDAI
jgi:hypothetical protein